MRPRLSSALSSCAALPHRVLWILAIAIVLPVGFAHGYIESHGPFDKKPRPFAVRECVQVYKEYGEAEALRSIHILKTERDSASALQIRVECFAHDMIAKVYVQDAELVALFPETLVADLWCFGTGYWGDFNLDGKTDFMLTFGSGGCGLAASYCTPVFILSSKEGYRATTIWSMAAGPEDLVSPFEDGKCYVVQTSFIGGEQGRDGKVHNYWVYHLLEIDGTEMRISKKSREFPKWVWYTYKANHEETDQLTSEQKVGLWERYAEREAQVQHGERSPFCRKDGIFIVPKERPAGDHR